MSGYRHIFLIFLLVSVLVKGQTLPKDTIMRYSLNADSCTLVPIQQKQHKVNHALYIVPISLITIGSLGMMDKNTKTFNLKIRDNWRRLSPLFSTKVDNFTQYAPLGIWLGLEIAGVKGKHTMLEQTLLAATTTLLTSGVVTSLKYICKERRPDYSANNSFPSGHTATAFSYAEFLRKEYSQVSPWIGVSGYCLAVTTGLLRVANNRHWMTDVLTGAGIGIACTNLTYFVYDKVIKKKKKKVWAVMPYYQEQQLGLYCNVLF